VRSQPRGLIWRSTGLSLTTKSHCYWFFIIWKCPKASTWCHVQYMSVVQMLELRYFVNQSWWLCKYNSCYNASLQFILHRISNCTTIARSILCWKLSLTCMTRDLRQDTVVRSVCHLVNSPPGLSSVRADAHQCPRHAYPLPDSMRFRRCS